MAAAAAEAKAQFSAIVLGATGNVGGRIVQLLIFCGARGYVTLTTRSGYRCTRAAAQRHIIPVKGFAGTASVQRHTSSVLGNRPADLAGCERFDLHL
jgi:hypothetical protein